MRKLIVISFLTFDGVMQSPGGEEEDTTGGFKYGGWQMSFPSQGDDRSDSPMSEALRNAGAMLLGRKTYDNFAGYWPTTGKDIPFYGSVMNNMTKYVASKTLKTADWQNSNLLKGDIADAVTKLKSEPGKNIYVLGSGDFCQTLMRHNLVDEYELMVYPLVLGQGKRLFREESAKQNLTLVKSKPTKSGILLLTYKTNL